MSVAWNKLEPRAGFGLANIFEGKIGFGVGVGGAGTGMRALSMNAIRYRNVCRVRRMLVRSMFPYLSLVFTVVKLGGFVQGEDRCQGSGTESRLGSGLGSASGLGQG